MCVCVCVCVCVCTYVQGQCFFFLFVIAVTSFQKKKKKSSKAGENLHTCRIIVVLQTQEQCAPLSINDFGSWLREVRGDIADKKHRQSSVDTASSDHTLSPSRCAFSRRSYLTSRERQIRMQVLISPRIWNKTKRK